MGTLVDSKSDLWSQEIIKMTHQFKDFFEYPEISEEKKTESGDIPGRHSMPGPAPPAIGPGVVAHPGVRRGGGEPETVDRKQSETEKAAQQRYVFCKVTMSSSKLHRYNAKCRGPGRSECLAQSFTVACSVHTFLNGLHAKLPT